MIFSTEGDIFNSKRIAIVEYVVDGINAYLDLIAVKQTVIISLRIKGVVKTLKRNFCLL